MRAFNVALAFVMGCGSVDIYDTGDAPAFSGQWLQLDSYFPSHCFWLVEGAGTVTIFEEGELAIEEKDWKWSHPEPNLYVIEDYNLHVYNAPAPGCFDLDYHGLVAVACPCSILLP